MALGSNFTSGFANGLTIRGVPLTVANPGKVFWVSNATTLQTGQRGGSDANHGTYDSPFATLSYAVSQCVANRGDIIFVKPGHAEAIASAGAIALNVAGVTVVGLGVGSARPKFTLGTANTATIAVSADNVCVINCQFVANFLSIATCFLLTTAKNFTVQNCTFADTSSILNFLNCIKSTGIANTVDGLTVIDSAWNGLGTTSVNSFILSANDIDGAVLLRNNVKLARTATAAILGTLTAGAMTNLICTANKCISQQTADTGGAVLSIGSSSTGLFNDNLLGDLTTTSDLLVTTSVGLTFDNNKKTGVISASGFLSPAADS